VLSPNELCGAPIFSRMVLEMADLIEGARGGLRVMCAGHLGRRLADGDPRRAAATY
jgi:hypothetical protein